MALEWIVTTVLFSACLYLLIMVFYFKTLLRKEKRSNIVVKHTLSDAEVVIRKYQVQLQRSLGNIDILSDELKKVKNDLKSLRTRIAQYRIENDKLHERIKELERENKDLKQAKEIISKAAAVFAQAETSRPPK